MSPAAFPALPRRALRFAVPACSSCPAVHGSAPPLALPSLSLVGHEPPCVAADDAALAAPCPQNHPAPSAHPCSASSAACEAAAAGGWPAGLVQQLKGRNNLYPVSLERPFGGEIRLQRRRGSGTGVQQGRRASVPRLGRDAAVLAALDGRAALGGVPWSVTFGAVCVRLDAASHPGTDPPAGTTRCPFASPRPQLPSRLPFCGDLTQPRWLPGMGCHLCVAGRARWSWRWGLGLSWHSGRPKGTSGPCRAGGASGRRLGAQRCPQAGDASVRAVPTSLAPSGALAWQGCGRTPL